jgi:ferric iron reductase protein FhuF
MLDFLADKTAERVAMVDVESKDIGNMTARERLHELEPTAELLAAFTRLVTAISRAKADIEQDLGIWNHLGVVVNWLLGACKMHLGKLLGACKLHL